MKTKFEYTPDDRLELLRQLVSINSGTANRSGVNEVQRLVRAEADRVGFKTELLPNPQGEDRSGELLVGTVAGNTKKFITLVTHADTVFEPKSGFDRFAVAADGSTATGPGTIDDKGGIVVALRGIRSFLLSARNSHFSLRMICAPSEETGSHGFWKKFGDYAKESVLVLGFEPSLDNGSIIESRAGNRWYRIEVEGKEAHTGRAHKKGVNAGHELAIKLDQLQRLTDYNHGVAVSIASLSGGSDKYNMVCGHAEAKIDARFVEQKEGDRLHKKILAILKKVNVRSFEGKRPSKTRFYLENDCPAFTVTPLALPYIRQYRTVVQEVEGREVSSQASGGAADSNGMVHRGVAILDGLGATGGGMHTFNEYVKISSLYTRAEALSRFLSRVNAIHSQK